MWRKVRSLCDILAHVFIFIVFVVIILMGKEINFFRRRPEPNTLIITGCCSFYTVPASRFLTLFLLLQGAQVRAVCSATSSFFVPYKWPIRPYHSYTVNDQTGAQINTTYKRPLYAVKTVLDAPLKLTPSMRITPKILGISNKEHNHSIFIQFLTWLTRLCLFHLVQWLVKVRRG